MFSNNAYAQEPMVMKQTTPNGKVKVELNWGEVLPDVFYNIGVRFLDPSTDQPLVGVSIDYEVLVLQYEHVIESHHDKNTNSGTEHFEVLFPEDHTGPAQVIITIKTMNDGSGWVQMQEEVSFDVHQLRLLQCIELWSQ